MASARPGASGRGLLLHAVAAAAALLFSLVSCAEPPPFQTASMCTRSGDICSQTLTHPNTRPIAAETLAFFAVSDWGGQALPPYTTPLELENAEAMGAFARPRWVSF